MTDTTDDLRHLFDTAARLGLSGVMVMSRRCEKCGQYHDWDVMSDAGDAEKTTLALLWALYKTRNEEPDVYDQPHGAH